MAFRNSKTTSKTKLPTIHMIAGNHPIWDDMIPSPMLSERISLLIIVLSAEVRHRFKTRRPRRPTIIGHSAEGEHPTWDGMPGPDEIEAARLETLERLWFARRS